MGRELRRQVRRRDVGGLLREAVVRRYTLQEHWRKIFSGLILPMNLGGLRLHLYGCILSLALISLVTMSQCETVEEDSHENVRWIPFTPSGSMRRILGADRRRSSGGS